MKVKTYKCIFLSDIVLPASSNTQGNILQQDFIPGSNFLGITARAYKDFGDRAFDVFHSGAVRFGDAHLSIGGEPSFKIPLSFHKLKIGEGYYNRLHLSEEEEQEFRKQHKQLKQVRQGYMNVQGKMDVISYNYTQKSSYDKALRRSKDEGMYGYSAMPAGTEWYFRVEYDDEDLVTQVESALLGERRLGKSRSAQYGQVRIEETEVKEYTEQFIPTDGLTYIYVLSRLALHDEAGNFTTVPSTTNLGIENTNIVWEKSYIRTSNYTPFNATRKTKEYTRLCIDKGSIIALKGCDPSTVPSVIGAFQSEGFGQLLVNPKFLEPKEPCLNKVEEKPKKRERRDEPSYTSTVAFLVSKHQEEEEKFAMAGKVNGLYDKLIGPSRSQWGQIRTFASIAKNPEDLLQKVEQYISSGSAKKQWEGKRKLLLDAIKEAKAPMAFTKLLAMTVSKHTRGGKDGK